MAYDSIHITTWERFRANVVGSLLKKVVIFWREQYLQILQNHADHVRVKAYKTLFL